jgi:glycosyltransferase involved in cell wall biosynthesis
MTPGAPRPLTILQVITQRRFSGAERVCLWLSSALQARGHRVLLACKPGEPMQSAAAARGLATYLPAMSGKLNVLAPFRLAGLAREVGADVIHSHLSSASLWGGLAGRIAGIPVVSHVHALNSAFPYRRANLIVTCSEGVRDHLIARGLPPGQVRAVLNGVDPLRLEDLAPAPHVRADLGIPPDAPVVGCVAHLSPKKGQEYLLRAVASLTSRWPQLRCLLVGEGPMRQRLESLARKLGIADRVHLPGYRPDAMSLMNVMDVVVLPLVAKEGLGLVLVEAALLGKPTVASDAPGITEALAVNETGLVFPPGDAETLAGCLDRLLSDAALCHRLGSAGRERALRVFSLDTMAERIEALYYDLLAAR